MNPIDPNAQHLKSTVALTFSGRNLPSKDLLSQSDPMIVLSRWDGARWVKFGRTEHIKNERNPVFRQVLNTDYFFEQEQRFRCDVYDVDSDILDDLHRHDYLGYAEFFLGRLVSAPGSTLQILLSKMNGQTRTKASIIIRGDELKQSSDFALVDIHGVGLKKKSLLFGKDDTFITLSRTRPDGTELVVYRSEIVMDNQNPKWRPFKISMGALTDNNPEATFTVRVTHQREGLSTSKLEVIGEVRVSINDIGRQDGTKGDKLIQLLKKGGKGPQGQLRINRFHVYHEHSFLEYLAGGLDMRLVVAVDFTGSNGAIHDPRSLHHVNPHRPNEYETAIRSVGGILCNYTKKATFPTLGFGALINGQQQTSHCFPLDLGVPMATQPGVDGILSRYHFALNRVQLSGPTLFESIIATAGAMSREPFTPDHQHYTTLLILTDGVINDMEKTIRSIITHSTDPFSIIIVGVGGADFRDMNILDADERALQIGSLIARRDIVQFVPMRSVLSGGPQTLAQHVLAELPQQVTGFMNLHNIKPLQAQQFKAVAEDELATNTGIGAAPALLQQPSVLQGQQQPQQQQGSMYPSATIPAQNPSGGAPAPQYGAPAPQYGAPAPQYGAPAPQYGAPAAQYGAPAPQYGAPAPQYGAPAQYTAPR